MSHEERHGIDVLQKRIYRKAQVPGIVRSGQAGAPGNRSVGPVDDISSAFGFSGFRLLGFAMTGGDNGGFETNPGGDDS